ncbi:unnamed protein product [Paramecium octaurelia]|uniref:MORN repeat-containing protein 3 n=1 Tax=Paramecium octaurelia TaxID=43137 RepID=A0A8S1Y6U5_PAROT|nr:unnamed protein product [Paramecium octaurelia]
MNTNFQITIQTFKQLHEPLQKLPKTCLFTELCKTKDNKITKKKIFQTKKAWLTWKESITRELIHQRTLSAMYPGKVLTILNYTVETINHQRNLYITYDCGDDVEPLFQYLNNNSVSFQEQTQIFEQLLQITCILHKSQFEHTNLKPNNILYKNKQVLITDFGSARTNYQNFLKQYSASAEKDWQNNLIFFYPQEYQIIMTEDNVDFREESWEKLKVEMSNKSFRKMIDTWALSMMMMQVFENNQILPNKLHDYYGLNNGLLLQKIEKLKQFSAGIYSEVIHSLVIQKIDPESVYQKFLKQKQMVKSESSSMESTFTIKQIFDLEPEDTYFPSYKPENYFLDKKEIKKIEEQYDDDASSVISSTYQIDVIGYTENKPNNLTQVPNLLPPLRGGQAGIGRQKPQTQKYDVAQNGQMIFGFQDKEAPKDDTKKRNTIMITNYDILNQQNQGSYFQEPPPLNGTKPHYPIQSEIYNNNENQNQISLKKVQDKPKEGRPSIVQNDPNVELELNKNKSLNPLSIISVADFVDKDSENNSPRFPQNQTSNFQFLEAQNLDAFKEKGDYYGGGGGDFINTFENFQIANLQPDNLLQFEDPNYNPNNTGRFIGSQDQLQPHKKFIDLLEIDDQDNQYKPPIQNQPNKEIIKPDQQEEANLIQVDPKDKKMPDQIIPQKGSLIILNANQNGIPIMEIRDLAKITKPLVPILQQTDDYDNLNNEDFKLVQISENDDNDKGFVEKEKRQSLIQIGKNDRQFQPISQIDDYIQEKPDGGKIPTNPYSLDVIKKILQEGVTQLSDQEQPGVIDNLKLIQKILSKVVQNITDPQEIFDHDLKPQEQIQVQQFLAEISNQNEQDMLKLIEDVNDTVDLIQQKQQVVHNIDNKEIEKNPLLLNLLNEEELKRVKQRNQGTKILTDKIDKLLEVKDDLKKFKQNPNMQNLLKKQQIDLLNKEELKIYQRLLEIMPKDKRQGDKILIQQREIQRRLDELQKQEKEEAIQKKLAAFLQDPSYDKLLLTNDLMQLTDDQKKKYQAALEDLLLKVPQRQQKSIQQQIDLLKKDNKKKADSKKIEISISEKQKNPSNEQQFKDAYMHVMKQLGEEEDGEVFSKNQYIRGFQQSSTSYQITDIIPDDCQKYSQQSTKRITKFYDFQGQKYKGQTLNDQPDGMGILRKEGVSSIYKGIFKQGKFYWGQVLEMNDDGLLTQYVGYYHQQYQVKHGRAKLKWYQPKREGLCGVYQFDDHDRYEGDFVLGYIHGKGKKIYKDLSEYEGDWKKNKRAGQGRLTLKNKEKKTITYEGEFQNDVQHGKDVKAIHHHQTGQDLVVQGEYRNGKPCGQHQLIFNKLPQRQIDY